MIQNNIVMGAEAFDCPIQKTILYKGIGQVDYVNGTKVHYHYKTVKAGTNELVDDSKASGNTKPMELVIGKKFKLEAWENCLKSMWTNEIAKFTVKKELLTHYPVVAKQLRDYYKKLNKTPCGENKGCSHEHDHNQADESHSHHSCGYHAFKNGLGYTDLDELMKTPQDLEFIFEIVKVEQPNEYKKDSWLLSSNEQIELIPKLKQEGNELYNQKQYTQACEKYTEALGFLENLMLKEKPHDVEWLELNSDKLKILLNYAQCKILLNDYYQALEHLNEILKYDVNNIKALYRRSKVNRLIYNYTEAKSDLNKIVRLDDSMRNLCFKDLKDIESEVKANNEKDKSRFMGKLF